MMDKSDSQPTVTAKSVVDLLRQKNLTLATAESCTGGLLSAAITAVPGASSVFPCGITAYTATCKRELLSVPETLLRDEGTVSPTTAAAMADGVRRQGNTTIGVAITGVAGPDPTEGKPVGTVYIALCNGERVWTQALTPDMGLIEREEIRQAAVKTALAMIRTFAEAYPAMAAGGQALTPPSPVEVVIPEAPTTGNRRRFLALLLPWKGDSSRERITKVTCWLLAIALVAVCILTATRLISGSENQSLYQDLQNIYDGEEDLNTSENGMLSRFESLYSQNADIGGWIRIDGTGISYPVMKNAGSNYYADHNFRQQYSTYGVPYFHSRNSFLSADTRNRTLIVYGNNTRDRQMFSDLLQYRQMNFFKQHATVDVSTLFSADRWLLFAVMILDPNEINAFAYDQTAFADDDAFLSYVSDIRKRSLWNTSVEVNADDELLLLVTQAEEEYGFNDALMVVVGRRCHSNETLAEDSLSVTRNPTVLMPRVLARQNRPTTTTKRTTAATGTVTDKSAEITTPASTTTEITGDTTTPSTGDTLPTDTVTTVTEPSESTAPPVSPPTDNTPTPDDGQTTVTTENG